MTDNLPNNKQCETSLSKPQQTTPTCLSQWMEKFSTPSRLMQVYSSANWVYAIENPKGAYMNYTPTLFDISNVFGADTMVNWVATNVMAIWYVKPDNNPQIYDQAKAWAKMWSRMNKNYTIGELTLFFARCQAGKYFLGNRLDITRIGNVFEEKFKAERASELKQYI